MTARSERDSLGERVIPAGALWGIHTLRALENFPFSGRRLADEPELLDALLLVKRAAAEANRATGALTPAQADAIIAACDAVLGGQHRDQFPVDPLESSGGTSLNMNLNEVLANLALEQLGRARGDPAALDPIDHVNAAQSTNDVLPTALVIAARRLAGAGVAALNALAAALEERALALASVPQLGRTCLMDAQPVTIGQWLGGQAALARRLSRELAARAEGLATLPLGGTAVGAGWGTRPGYRAAAVAALRRLTGLRLTVAPDPFDALANADGLARMMAEAATAADALAKLGQDLALLASGPAGGIGELRLPALQAGSSMMPGKVNPVLPMALVQLSIQLAGHQAAVAGAASLGQLAINAYEPVMAVNLLGGLRLLARVVAQVAERCIPGLEADAARARANLLASPALAVLLQPRLGYAATAALVKRAAAGGQPLGALAVAEGLLTAAEIEALLAGLAGQKPG